MRISEPEARREFAKHVATRSQCECHLGTIDVLEWAQPGCSNFRIVYTLRNGVLHVDGDLGAACYQWYGKTTLEAIAGYSMSYFREKCQASEYNHRGMEWDRDTAESNLQDRIDSALEEHKVRRRGEDGKFLPVPKCTAAEFIESFTAEDALDNEWQWGNLLYENNAQSMLIPGTEDIDKEWDSKAKAMRGGIFLNFEEGWDIGMVTGRRIEWHKWGLKLAIEQLEARNVNAA
jgi:hypothetical protein